MVSSYMYIEMRQFSAIMLSYMDCVGFFQALNSRGAFD